MLASGTFGGLVVSMLASGTFGGLVVSMLASGTFGVLVVSMLSSGTFGGLVVSMLASGTFGGLVVSMLVPGTQNCGFAPIGFFGGKILSISSFGRGRDAPTFLKSTLKVNACDCRQFFLLSLQVHQAAILRP
jgi:hypothetical protein